ncbi:SLC13 family permease [Desulfovibrio sp.]|uniref:SLC13 family permease n=1 Tax=Desulfovibrio sp. TaxID=885 RepID=UPI003D0AFC07
MAETTFDIKTMIKWGLALASVALGAWVGMMQPPEGLSPQAMRAMGILIWAVGWWVTRVVPEYMTALMMCTLWVAFKTAKFTTAFSVFSTGAWWIMLAAFGMGAVATKVGLVKRIALWVLTLFPSSFNGQIVGLICAGTAVSPFIPSQTAKGAMSTPLAMAISDTLGIERKTPPAAALLVANFIGFNIMGHIFLSGSFSHYTLLNVLPPEYQNISWGNWLLWALPWGLTMAIGMAVALMFFYKPKEKLALPAGFAKQELKKLGAMGKTERSVMIIISLCLLFWVFEWLHGISSSVVALTGLSALIGFNFLTTQDFRNGIDWPSMVLVGCVLNMAAVLKELKVDLYLSNVLQGNVALLGGTAVVLLVTVVALVYLIRFVFINMTSLTSIMCLVLVPLILPMGYHPWIVLFVVYSSANVFLIPYMSTQYMAAQGGVRWELAKHSDVFKGAVLFQVVALAGVVISVPWWKMLGLLP